MIHSPRAAFIYVVPTMGWSNPEKRWMENCIKNGGVQGLKHETCSDLMLKSFNWDVSHQTCAVFNHETYGFNFSYEKCGCCKKKGLSQNDRSSQNHWILGYEYPPWTRPWWLKCPWLDDLFHQNVDFSDGKHGNQHVNKGEFSS